MDKDSGKWSLMPPWAFQLLENQKRMAQAINDLAIALSNVADGLDEEARTQRLDEAEKKGILLALAAKGRPSSPTLTVAGAKVTLSKEAQSKIFHWAIVGLAGLLTHLVHWFLVHRR